MSVKIFDFEILEESQIGIILSRLEEAPTLNETNGVENREVVMKLFNPHMCLFVVEYDPNERLIYGFVQNSEDDDCGDWGHSSIDMMIGLGFEMDLSFSNRVITLDGTVFIQEGKNA